MKTCIKCGSAENLAEPFVDGVCVGCLMNEKPKEKPNYVAIAPERAIDISRYVIAGSVLFVLVSIGALVWFNTGDPAAGVVAILIAILSASIVLAIIKALASQRTAVGVFGLILVGIGVICGVVSLCSGQLLVAIFAAAMFVAGALMASIDYVAHRR